jgi:hypothetical protein
LGGAWGDRVAQPPSKFQQAKASHAVVKMVIDDRIMIAFSSSFPFRAIYCPWSLL